MKTPRHIARAGRGAALTEFVVVLPVFVAVIYGSMYLAELGNVKLKAQEIARYSAWGFAVRPLSDYEDFDHRAQLGEVTTAVADELVDLYSDLNGTTDMGRPMVRSGMTLSGVYQAPGPGDLRMRRVELVPGSLNNEWASDLSTGGFVLNTLNVGTSTQDLFAAPFDDLKLNRDGFMTARARVGINPPLRPVDAQRAWEMARLGRRRGADLTRWSAAPNAPGSNRFRDIRHLTGDGQRKPIEVAMITDSWRVTQGFTAHPGAPGHYAATVREVSENAINALPGGPVLNFVLNAQSFTSNLPGGLGVLFGAPPDAPDAHVFSRPYVAARGRRPPHRGQTAAGQVDIFREVNATDGVESGGVHNFESSPLYEDPQSPGSSKYLESLNARGNYFMGCSDAERRRCVR